MHVACALKIAYAFHNSVHIPSVIWNVYTFQVLGLILSVLTLGRYAISPHKTAGPSVPGDTKQQLSTQWLGGELSALSHSSPPLVPPFAPSQTLFRRFLIFGSSSKMQRVAGMSGGMASGRGE